MSEIIQGSPTKAYFINMMTKDISIEDSILDLIDNCLDGAKRQIAWQQGKAVIKPNYNGYQVRIDLNEHQFSIEDNCGGIDISLAQNYAFHFGKRAEAPSEANYSIGLYGIGMKRAIFKIGQHIRIHSSTKTEAFSVDIDINQWAKKANHWTFELEREAISDTPGTRIEITNLHENVRKEFAITNVFTNRLYQIMARDYSFPLHDGFSIILNGNPVKPYQFQLRESEAFLPMNYHYQDEVLPEVSVQILAGLNGFPPDDSSSDEVREQLRDIAYFGWFVVCNGRIVLAGDKTEKTVWGNGRFSLWHPQYHGFIGIVSFYAADPNLLPWTTTKRALDLTHPLYRRVVVKMKEATRRYVNYTNERKEDLERAKNMEKKAPLTPITQLNEHALLILPHLSKSPMVEMVQIKYYKPKREVKKVKEALDAPFITHNEAGAYLFDNFLKTEASGY
jgi:hypothetical protein